MSLRPSSCITYACMGKKVLLVSGKCHFKSIEQTKVPRKTVSINLYDELSLTFSHIADCPHSCAPLKFQLEYLDLRDHSFGTSSDDLH